MTYADALGRVIGEPAAVAAGLAAALSTMSDTCPDAMTAFRRAMHETTCAEEDSTTMSVRVVLAPTAEEMDALNAALGADDEQHPLVLRGVEDSSFRWSLTGTRARFDGDTVSMNPFLLDPLAAALLAEDIVRCLAAMRGGAAQRNLTERRDRAPRHSVISELHRLFWRSECSAALAATTVTRSMVKSLRSDGDETVTSLAVALPRALGLAADPSLLAGLIVGCIAHGVCDTSTVSMLAEVANSNDIPVVVSVKAGLPTPTVAAARRALSRPECTDTSLSRCLYLERDSDIIVSFNSLLARRPILAASRIGDGVVSVHREGRLSLEVSGGGDVTIAHGCFAIGRTLLAAVQDLSQEPPSSLTNLHPGRSALWQSPPSAVVCGEGSFMLEAVSVLLACGVKVVCCFTRDAATSAVATELHRISIVSTLRELTAFVTEGHVSLLVSANNLDIIPARVLDAVDDAINFHYGMLPRDGGINLPAWWILEDREECGVTWHTMEPGIDTGALIVQQSFSFDAVARRHGRVTSETILMTTGVIGLNLLQTIMTHYVATRCFVAMAVSGNRTFYPHTMRVTGIVDPALPVGYVHRLVRALDCGPIDNNMRCATLWMKGRPFVVRKVQVLADDEPAQMHEAIPDVVHVKRVTERDGRADAVVCHCAGNTTVEYHLESLTTAHVDTTSLSTGFIP
jgi:methionyl-tRNA formyltransferase